MFIVARKLQYLSLKISILTFWAIPPVRLGLSGRNSGKTPERPRKRSQSISWNSRREYGWDAPSPIIQGIWGVQSISRIISPPVRLGPLLFSEVVPESASQSRSWNSQQYWGYFWPSEFPTKTKGLVGSSLEIFNLAWKCHSFQSRLKISILCSILKFFKIWALWVRARNRKKSQKGLLGGLQKSPKNTRKKSKSTPKGPNIGILDFFVPSNPFF